MAYRRRQRDRWVLFFELRLYHWLRDVASWLIMFDFFQTFYLLMFLTDKHSAKAGVFILFLFESASA